MRLRCSSTADPIRSGHDVSDDGRGRVIWTSLVPVGVMRYDARFQIVDVLLVPDADASSGATMLALGSEFSGRGTGSLQAMSLDLAPYQIVDTPPARVMDPVVTSIRSRARPGRVELLQDHSSLTADAIWMAQPFGLAIWSFDDLIIEPHSAFLDDIASVDHVEICDGVVVGLNQGTGRLAFVLIDGFDRAQSIDGDIVSAATHGPDLMQALSFVHYWFFADPDVPVGEVNPMEALLLQPDLDPLVRRLILTRIADLNQLSDETDQT